MPTTSCGKSKDEECLFKDPVNCMTHMPETKTAKAGRRISAATRAKMEDAIGHHAAATKCLKDILDQPDDGDDDPADEQPASPAAEMIDENLSPEQRRLKHARALRESLNI